MVEEGLISKDDLMNELRESRLEVKRLKDQVEKMQPDVDEKVRLEEELVGQREKLDIPEMENTSLHQELKGKAEVLEACIEAEDPAQRLADKYQADLSQKEQELGIALSGQETDETFSSTSRELKRHRRDEHFELEMRQATRDELVSEQSTVKEKEGEIHWQGLKNSIESEKDSLRRVIDDLEQVTYQLRDRDEQLKSQSKSVDDLRASFEDFGRDKADAELNVGFIIRLSNLSIHTVATNVPDWAPLLRSLGVTGPVVITSDEGMPRKPG